MESKKAKHNGYVRREVPKRMHITSDEARAVQPLRLKNKNCPYCGISLHKSMDTKEHVVGKNFVPRGSLVKSWNLIVRACNSCNSKKASLEDDISAITMMPDAVGRYPTEDMLFINESKRKSEAISRTTRKPVKDSYASPTITYKDKNVTINIDSRCPPQLQPNRVWTLCSYQIRGFFACLMYDDNTGRVLFAPGTFGPVFCSLKSNWGSPVFDYFGKKTLEWKPVFIAYIAEGCYRVIIKRFGDSPFWSWAVEWNHNYRCVGFIGSDSDLDSIEKEMQSLHWGNLVIFSDGKNSAVKEVLLEEDGEDPCFTYNSELLNGNIS